MIRLLEEIETVREDKVLEPSDVDMLQGRDGFYYELIDGKYTRKHYFNIDFQGIRLTSLTQVMRDLDIL